MADDTNYTQEVFDIFYNNKGTVQDAINTLKEKGGKHLDLAISFGGMFLMIMGQHEYDSPHEVWDAVSNYEDMRNS